jgi:hypothetical protein
MPTYDFTDRFMRDYNALNHQQKILFNNAVKKFLYDLRTGHFRAGLRVKSYHGIPGAYEMTWAPDGRALFEYGQEVRPGHTHVIWLRVGGHEIFDNS